MTNEIVKLIEKFLSGTISDEEMNVLLAAYTQERISEKQLDHYYADKWNEAGQHPSPLAGEKKGKTWKALQEHLTRHEQTTPGRKRRWIAIASAAAAAVVFFMLGLWLQPERNNPKKELVVTVENGQKASVQLPDGSHVRLNSASELRYSPDFGRKDRNVQLRGEAYFEVESDPVNPFIVQTRSGLQIKALGTKFNIKSYSNDRQITGTLLEGKIDVGNSSFSEILRPNERIVFDIASNTFQKLRIQNSEEAIFWLTEQFVFDRETLENIARMLERMYNVTVSFASPEIKEIRYSGKIKNNSMENVLNLITVVSPLQYTMTGSHITFSKKKN